MIFLQIPAFAAFLLLLTFLLGAVLGSFANCMAWRIARGEDFVHGRSHCPVCGHVLAARDLIPVLSYLMQRGRCRYCGAKLSRRYLLTELGTGLLFVLLLLRYGVSWAALQNSLLAVLLLAIALVDWDCMLIPNGLIVAGIGNRLLFALLSRESLLACLGNGLLIAVPLLLLVLLLDRLLGRESMGGGDVKLFFMLALYFDWRCSLLLLLLSCILGIFFALRMREKGAFPFGPAIAAAAVLCLFFAEPVVGLYLRVFF